MFWKPSQMVNNSVWSFIRNGAFSLFRNSGMRRRSREKMWVIPTTGITDYAKWDGRSLLGIFSNSCERWTWCETLYRTFRSCCKPFVFAGKSHAMKAAESRENRKRNMIERYVLIRTLLEINGELFSLKWGWIIGERAGTRIYRWISQKSFNTLVNIGERSFSVIVETCKRLKFDFTASERFSSFHWWPKFRFHVRSELRGQRHFEI